MGASGTFSCHRSRAFSLVTAIVMVAWLGMAAAPCQAAMGALHASTQHGTLPGDDCGHCPTPPSDHGLDCATMDTAECQSQGQAIAESRDTAKSQPVLVLPSASASFVAFVPGVGSSSNARNRPAPASRASVQQRYCTYLK
jgi:hypothetical protein